MEYFADFTWIKLMDLTATVVGLLYLWWEFRAHWLMWIASIIMPAIDLYLYWEKGLYGDFALAIYYLLIAAYGLWYWLAAPKQTSAGQQSSQKQKGHDITHIPYIIICACVVVFLLLWGGMYWMLSEFTDSTVPLTDSLTNALSIVGMWMLARKYLEQWFVWFVADAIYVGLYAYKGLPGKSFLYVVYTLFALVGYWNWRRKMKTQH